MVCTTLNAKDICAQPWRWMSPEALQTPTVYTSKSDIWSFGILCNEIYSNGVKPFDNLTKDELFNKFTTLNSTNEQIVLENLRYLPKILTTCLKFTPDERPTFTEIIKVLDDNKEKILHSFKISTNTVANTNTNPGSAYYDSQGIDEKMTAIADFNPLNFKKGDIITNIEEYLVDWNTGTFNGITGRFPASYVDEGDYGNEYIAKKDFNSTSFKKGESFEVTDTTGNNIWKGNKGGKEVIFPGIYVKRNDVHIVKAEWEFKPKTSDKLEFKRGDLIRVNHTENVWKGIIVTENTINDASSTVSKLFPVNFVTSYLPTESYYGPMNMDKLRVRKLRIRGTSSKT